MTFLPTYSRDVQGVNGEPYELNQRCAVTGCTETWRLERHHLYRKSFLVGDYWYVNLPDGNVRGNCVALCNKHHRDITENKARIVYLDLEWWWCPPEGDITRLAWQSPTKGDETVDEIGETLSEATPAAPEKIEESDSSPSLRDIAGVTVYPGHPLSDAQPTLVGEERMYGKEEFEQLNDHGPVCRTCHQRIKPPKPETPEKPKNRRTWSIAVPKERQEDGADVLDTLIDEARKELDAVGISYGDEHKYKYHVLSTSLALFVAHGRAVLSNG